MTPTMERKDTGVQAASIICLPAGIWFFISPWIYGTAHAPKADEFMRGTQYLRAAPDRSPHLARVGVNHRLADPAGESFTELGQVGDYAVDAIFVWRMRIGDSVQALDFGTFVSARPLGHSDEEALIGREAVASAARFRSFVASFQAR